MNFGQAFTYVFEDSDWPRKVLIPALISLIPIVGQFYLLGWSLDVTRRVIQHNPRPLPELDFGRQFIDGLKAFVIGLVYAIPVIIFTIPITVVSIAASNQNMNTNTASALVSVISICCGGLIFLYSILMAYVLPAAYANFAAADRLGAAFNFNEVMGLLRAAPGAFLLVLVGIIVTGFIAGLGVIACGIGVVVTTAYAQAVNGHLYGQGYLEATRNRGYAQAY